MALNKKPLSQNMQSGMTLVELVVVLVIVAVVSSVLIFNYSSFRNKVTLRSLAQEVALAVRKAQTYATSVRSIEGVSASTATFPAYGISFSVTNGTSANAATPSRAQFILFADIDGGSGSNGMYDNGGTCGRPSEGDECVESFSINSPDRVVRLCPEGNCLSTGTVDILFSRPAPDAIGCVVSGSSCDSDRPSYVDVVLQAPSGMEKTVTVWNTGQISVE